MSIWTRITEALGALTAGEGLAAVFDRLRTPPERTVGFAIAVIALSAKMAKADGTVTRDEVAAFRSVFYISPEDEAGAARVFNLARQDVAGFEEYARRIRRMFDGQREMLVDLLEGLFQIAMADGFYHAGEDAFLEKVAAEFQLTPAEFKALRARSVPNAEPDPYALFGLEPTATLDAVRARWRQLVRENHPDVARARGLPDEAVRMAQKRMTDLNRAWDQIKAEATP